MVYENLRNRNTRLSSRTLVIISLFFCLTIFYCTIVAVLCANFQGELAQLRTVITNLQPALKTTDNEKVLTTAKDQKNQCYCGGNSVIGTDPDSSNTAGDWTENPTFTKCCCANQNTLERLIAKFYDEQRWRHHNLRPVRNYITLGKIERLVESITQRNGTNVQGSSGIGAIIPVAIHVTSTLDCFKSSEPIGEKVKVGRWNSANGISFAEQVGNDGYHVIVPKSGLYYVYSQVGFQDDRTGDDMTGSDEYLHYTVLISTAYSFKNIDLMKSIQIRKGDIAYVSSFHSGLFKLREGDKIYMKVYLPSSEVQLACRQESTYMGMHLISEEQTA
ncbi:uncharacterized protein [Ptychodera flava]|uniref:uncharacterized protein n=1 Tax=Ptychodera flava TaxID=63121 RepID=UPI003969D39D